MEVVASRLSERRPIRPGGIRALHAAGALGLCLLWAVAGCSSGSGQPTDGGADGMGDGDDRVACEPGQTRCYYQEYQECRDGWFTTVETCREPLVCAQDLGCTACNPGLPTVCVDGDVYACEPDGSIGALVERCAAGCRYGACEGGCSAASQLIYVVDDSYRLLSFSPQDDANAFELVCELDCPAGPSWPAWGAGGTATPFSMSVDRSARAWVLYTSGEIFWVDTASGHCSASDWVADAGGFELFGMGFVSDETGSETETLYIAGGLVGELAGGRIAGVDPDTLQVAPVGPVPAAEYSPELTGTGEARFYAYFPGQNDSFVAELSKVDGGIVQRWDLPPLGGTVRAWAFAHWGGKFYIFVTVREGDGNNSQVLRLDPDSGQTDTILEDLPYIIVGAGVSTCAPTYEP